MSNLKNDDGKKKNRASGGNQEIRPSLRNTWKKQSNACTCTDYPRPYENSRLLRQLARGPVRTAQRRLQNQHLRNSWLVCSSKHA